MWCGGLVVHDQDIGQTASDPVPQTRTHTHILVTYLYTVNKMGRSVNSQPETLWENCGNRKTSVRSGGLRAQYPTRNVLNSKKSG